jgi:hypothetical protein
MSHEVWVAVITAIAIVAAAWITNRAASRRVQHIREQLDTGNGHTLGEAVANLESGQRLAHIIAQEQVASLQSFDRRLTAHIEESTALINESKPLAAWVTAQMQEKEESA